MVSTMEDTTGRITGISESSPHRTTAAIDRAVFRQRCLGNAAFGTALLAELGASGPVYVEAIDQHARAGDCRSASEQAHALKGAAAILGAEPLRSLAAQIEGHGRANNLAGMLGLLQPLQAELQRCLADAGELQAELLVGPFRSSVSLGGTHAVASL